jgi:hypothetical protein
MSRIKESKIVYNDVNYDIVVYYETFDNIERVVKTECEVEIFRIDENYENLFESQKLFNEKLNGSYVCTYCYWKKPKEFSDEITVQFNVIESHKTVEILNRLKKGSRVLTDVDFGMMQEGRQDSFMPTFYVVNEEDDFDENNKFSGWKQNQENNS